MASITPPGSPAAKGEESFFLPADEDTSSGYSSAVLDADAGQPAAASESSKAKKKKKKKKKKCGAGSENLAASMAKGGVVAQMPKVQQYPAIFMPNLQVTTPLVLTDQECGFIQGALKKWALDSATSLYDLLFLDLYEKARALDMEVFQKQYPRVGQLATGTASAIQRQVNAALSREAKRADS